MTEHEPDDDEGRRERALARAEWPIRAAKLEDSQGDDLSETTTMAERVAMVWRLTQDAWALTGRPMPTYARSEMPGRVIGLRTNERAAAPTADR